MAINDLDDFLEAPCKFCKYNGPGYWQVGTHAESCPWRDIGGEADRKGRLPQVIREIRDAQDEAWVEGWRECAKWVYAYQGIYVIEEAVEEARHRLENPNA